MSNEMQRRSVVGEVAGIPDRMESAWRLCETLAGLGNAIPRPLRGEPGAILAVVKAGAELGIPPMKAMGQVYLMDGSIIIGAHLLTGLAQAHPACEWFMVTESTSTAATAKTQRRGYPEPMVLRFTIEDAKTAGLANRGTWRNHPAAMLRARAQSQLARMAYADILAGVYTNDEAADWNDGARTPRPEMGQPSERQPPTRAPVVYTAPADAAPEDAGVIDGEVIEPLAPSPEVARAELARAVDASGLTREQVDAWLVEHDRPSIGAMPVDRIPGALAWLRGDGVEQVSAWLKSKRNGGAPAPTELEAAVQGQHGIGPETLKSWLVANGIQGGDPRRMTREQAAEAWAHLNDQTPAAWIARPFLEGVGGAS